MATKVASKKREGTKRQAKEVGLVPKKKPGRPPKPRVIPDFVQPLGTNLKVVPVDLAEIDLADTSYQFRVNLRVADLVDSIQQNGQQLPVILRRHKGQAKYQVISGFRRLNAITRIGWASANAIVLDDVSDEDAWKVSVLENEARKTYSDLDRAYAIVAYRKIGHTMEDIGKTVFKLSRKQATRLNSLVALPKEVQDALAEGRITTTHALVMKQLRDKLGALNFKHWIGRVEKEGLSVSQMKAAILEEQREKGKDGPITLFVRQQDKAIGREVYRFRPVRVDPEALSDMQRKALAEGLEEVLKDVRGSR